MMKQLLSISFFSFCMLASCTGSGEKKIHSSKVEILEETTKDQTEMYLLVGTYTSNGSKSEGIYVYNFDEETGQSTYTSQVKVNNPSYLAPIADGSRVYAVSENGDGTDVLNALSFDKETGELQIINSQPTNGTSPCYVTTNMTGSSVITANYMGGSITVFETEEDGTLLPAANLISFSGKGTDKERQSQPHLHTVQYSPDRRFVFATDLGTDKIYKFEVNAADARNYLKLSKPADFKVKAGSGPRHIAFHPQHTYMYMVTELSGDVIAYHYNNGNLEEFQTIKADSLNAQGSADIHISPDGEYLYTSHRLKGDGLAIFSIDKSSGMLTEVGYQNTGLHPRNFIITPNGKYLLVACRDSNIIQVYERNVNTGLLTYLEQDIVMDQPVCLKFIAK